MDKLHTSGDYVSSFNLRIVQYGTGFVEDA